MIVVREYRRVVLVGLVALLVSLACAARAEGRHAPELNGKAGGGLVVMSATGKPIKASAKGAAMGPTEKPVSSRAARSHTPAAKPSRQPRPPKSRATGPSRPRTAAASPKAASTTSRTSAPSGLARRVAKPARTGHIVTRHGFHVGDGFWLALGALAALGTGVLAAWGEPQRRFRTWTSSRRGRRSSASTDPGGEV
jgi:hypothetical protein